MTIDKAIANERKIIEKCKTEYELECARYGKRTVDSFGKLECIKVAEEHEQLADWLEELKEYKENQHRSLRHTYEKGYKKAIYDIKEKLMKNGFIYTQHALYVFNEMAEQLKAGVNNGTDNK